MNTEKSPLDKYLYRLQGNSGTGWQLRLPSRIHPGGLTHFFSDSLFGGNALAKEAARGMRDRLLERNKAELHVGGYSVPQKSRSQQGLPAGICLRPKPRKSGPPRWNWVVYWSRDNQTGKREFSVKKWGLRQGLEKAAETRKEKAGLVVSEREFNEALLLAMTLTGLEACAQGESCQRKGDPRERVSLE